MNLRERLTQRNIIIAVAVLVVGLMSAAYFVLRRPPRVPMEKYVPASALAFIEIDNLTDVVSGLASTRAWREMAPVLGISSQIKLASFVADLIGRTGIGPDVAVLAGRAQCAFVLMGVDGKAEIGEETLSFHLKPRWTFIIETHANSSRAARVMHEWSPSLARRIFGDSFVEESAEHQGELLSIFRSSDAERELVTVTTGSRIVIGNNREAVRSCLDAIAGRAATLADNDTLKQMRPRIGQNAQVFGFVTESGIEHLIALAPVIIASRSRVEPKSLAAFAELFDHLSKQSTAGFLYASEFTREEVTEKFLTVLRQPVAEGLVELLKPASRASFEALNIVPRDVSDVTVWIVERAGDLPERALQALAPRVDVVARIALQEFIISYRKRYGLEPSDSVGDAVGDGVTIINFGDGNSAAMIFRVRDKDKLLVNIGRYLRKDNSRLSIEQYKDVEIALSTNEDGRAAAYVGDFLVLGTREQIIRIVDARASGNSIATDERLKQAIDERPSGATIFAFRPDTKDAGELMLAISKLTPATNGSRKLLEQDAARKAMARIPPSLSYTEFRDYGIYTETRSAVGSFTILGRLIGGSEESR